MYSNIPLELRVLRQWVVWRFEHVKNQAKLTKVPYNPHTNKHASSTDPETWSDFAVCEAAVQAGVGWHGVGFVLSPHDPYCFVDLDPVKDEHGNRIEAPEIERRQTEVFRTLNSYSELSPSRAGLHIIVKAQVPQGRKRDYIEVYSSGRFMTMTGEVYHGASIEPRQESINALWQSLARTDGINYSGAGDGPETADDMTVYGWASAAANGEKFTALWSGNWQQYYTSQSEADFALIDILGFYSHNRAQIERMFKLSALGQRDKANRKDYVQKMILAAEDKRPPTIDFEATAAIRAQLAAMTTRPVEHTEAIIEPGTVETIPTPSSEWTYPPGLVGQIAEFIYAASPRPVRQIALAAALAMTAGIVGRQWNVSGTGLNLYIMLIAPTGTGKEAISSGIDKLFNQVTSTMTSAEKFIGPGDFASAQALIKTLAVKQCCVVISGEFGLRMQQMASRHASPTDIGIKRMLLDLYNKSGRGQSIKPLVYSDKAKDTDLIKSPALTMIGETTPTTLYSALDESLIADGLLPRFITTEYTGPRPPLNEGHGDVRPSDQLVNDLCLLTHYAHSYNQQDHVIDVRFTDEGRAVSTRFDKYADAQINTTKNEIYKQLWNRAHIKAMKLAAVVAVGICPWEPVIDEHCMQWACEIVNNEIVTLLTKFDRGEIGREDQNEITQLEFVRTKITEYMKAPYDELKTYHVTPQMHADGIIEWAYLQRRCLAVAAFRLDRVGATNALKRAVQALVDADSIREVAKPVVQSKYGVSSRVFAVVQPNHFL